MLSALLAMPGGAFFVNGNVNPAAEANFYGDPDAANVVLGARLSLKSPLSREHSITVVNTASQL